MFMKYYLNTNRHINFFIFFNSITMGAQNDYLTDFTYKDYSYVLNLNQFLFFILDSAASIHAIWECRESRNWNCPF